MALGEQEGSHRGLTLTSRGDQGLCIRWRTRTRLKFMAYFIEYVTPHAVGRSTVDSGDFHDALAKAQQALKGLPGVKAVLRYAVGSSPAFGEGVVLAAFTWAEGRQMHEADPDSSAFT